MEVTAPTKRTKSNEEESSTLTALTVDGDYVLDSCSERNFDDHECSKVYEVFLVAIDVWAAEVNLLVGRPFPVYIVSACALLYCAVLDIILLHS